MHRKEYSKKVDIYSLGLVFAQILFHLTTDDIFQHAIIDEDFAKLTVKDFEK